jgi:acyl-CoA reductase-like NAD-dependent aldehyde dehydrogenase
MPERADLLRLFARALRRRRELCRLLTEDQDREPPAEEQRAWLGACERVRRLRAEAEGRG